MLYPAELPGRYLLPSMFALSVQPLAWAALALAALLATPAARADCAAGTRERVEVARVLDGRTFAAVDGRVMRLPALEGVSAGAAAALATALGASAEIVVLPRGRDRWDRVLVNAWREERSVDAAMLSGGFAHAAIRERGLCAEPLLAAETAARTARLGIWKERGPALVATDLAALTRGLGSHALVEGTIASARAYRGRLYLNFARYWRRGLTLIVRERELPRLGIIHVDEAQRFVGQRVRVRGHIEWRGGPVIQADGREPVEFLETK